eukprot:10155377-Alexandrium_andersonii.AAC.1
MSATSPGDATYAFIGYSNTGDVFRPEAPQRKAQDHRQGLGPQRQLSRSVRLMAESPGQFTERQACPQRRG